MAKKPRFYQNEATDAFFASIAVKDTHPLIGLPTGSGKALVAAMIAKRALEIAPMARVMISTSAKELVDQDAKELIEYWPYAPAGIYSAGLSSKESDMQITLGTVQSMAKKPELFGKQNILLIDEAQLVSPEDETLYQKLIAGLRKKNPNLVVGGLSATLYRSKGGFLIDHGLFNKVCYDITGREAFETLVNMGYLVPLRSRPTNFFFDTTGVKTTAGDYNEKQLEEVVNVHEKTITALAEALEIGKDLGHWIIFCTGIDHIKNVVDILSSWGESIVSVHSKMKSGERDENIDTFKTGKARMIAADGVLVTGFNSPFVDHIVNLRPSKSVVRHVQGLGRGTRPWYAPGFDMDTVEGRLAAIHASGREFCRVSDFGRNLERLGPINDPKIPGKKGKGDMPIKICETDKLVRGVPRGPVIGCGCYNFCAARKCDDCKEEFIFDEQPKIDRNASNAVATRLSKVEVYWAPVDDAKYEKFTRPYAKPAMRVVYKSTINRYTEMISLENESPYARHMAHEWWKERGYEPPETTEEGLEYTDELPIPKWILVQVGLKHPRIVQASFDIEKPELKEYAQKYTG